ncbi:MAG: 30S ribosomal protein S12 methylthiotransferase RimO [Christensenellaceae bacterium]|nr:30S ribosomal protein S12 methylthiotransferase RimO [Christensenellaceae bacterium]
MRAGIISLGCAKNQVDTEELLYYLRLAGIELTNIPDEADILIVNTCGFIESAKQESIDAILSFAKFKEIGSCKLLCVTGCLSQRYSKELMDEIPEIDIITGIAQYDILTKLISDALNTNTRHCDVTRHKPKEAKGRILLTKPYTAYVRISDGCDNRCSYCAIPLIRGAFVSRNEENILGEMKNLADNGVKEHIIIAQDTTRYGTDTKESSIIKLIDKASKIEGIDWLRLLYCYPDETTYELIDTMASHDNLCKYLDLPLQHASDKMLKLMNRRGDISKVKDILYYARSKGFTLRTTFIVGFPGESDEDFETLLNFTAEMQFDRMGAFTYSREEDTPAYSMPYHVPEHIKRKRLDRLMLLQQEISLKRNRLRIGNEEKLLVIGKENGYYIARSEKEAPDVDGIIYLSSDEAIAEGSFVKAVIDDADSYDLYATHIGGK